MNILYYQREISSVTGLWPRVHFLDELKRRNCNVFVFNYLEYENLNQANDELLKYAELYEKGLLTDEEFAAMKKKIIEK